MGGGQSTPSPPPPPTIVEEPYPSVAGADGISLSQAVKCTDCQLGVDTNISVASVKLTRELGDITSTQCQSFNKDKERVKKDYLSITDFLSNLQAGKYAKPISEEQVTLTGAETTDAAGNKVPGPTRQVNYGYCQMLTISEEDASKVNGADDAAAKAKGGRIRKVSGSGGFSSGTKARFIPSIPFKMSFTATKAVLGANNQRMFKPSSETFTVTQLVLYYPSPIRVDSVQADAMLALNDPADPGANFIVLIPLRGTNRGDPSADFVNRIAKYVQSVREYDENSGTYPETTIQTGADWTLGKLFTLDKENGKGGVATVQNGFFTWTGVAGYERYRMVPTTETAEGRAMIEGREIRYKWRPIEGLTAPQYFLLDTPLDINSSDLAQLTRNLDATPASEAVHPIPAENDLVFHKGSVPPAPDSISGSAGCGAASNFCEGFTVGDLTKDQDKLNASCPGAKCDPFLQNANRSQNTLNSTFLFGILFQMMVVIAMTVGAYIALVMVGNDYDLGLRDFAEKAGMVLAVWAKAQQDKMPGLPKMPSFSQAPAVASMPQVPEIPKLPGALGKLKGLVKKR